MPSFRLVAVLSCIRNAFFGLVYSLWQKITGCILYTKTWTLLISNKLFLSFETSTRWHSLFFPNSQLVVPFTAFLVRDNACMLQLLWWKWNGLPSTIHENFQDSITKIFVHLPCTSTIIVVIGQFPSCTFIWACTFIFRRKFFPPARLLEPARLFFTIILPPLHFN